MPIWSLGWLVRISWGQSEYRKRTSVLTSSGTEPPSSIIKMKWKNILPTEWVTVSSRVRLMNFTKQTPQLTEGRCQLAMHHCSIVMCQCFIISILYLQGRTGHAKVPKEGLLVHVIPLLGTPRHLGGSPWWGHHLWGHAQVGNTLQRSLSCESSPEGSLALPSPSDQQAPPSPIPSPEPGPIHRGHSVLHVNLHEVTNQTLYTVGI